MNNHPEYSVRMRTSDFLLIEDRATEFECMSVTNGAEEVVRNLTENGFLAGRRLYYIDTTGRVDELLHENGEFKGFVAGYDSETEFWADHTLLK